MGKDSLPIMKILFVCNGLMKGNGLRTAVLASKARLIEAGMDVRILSSGNDDPDDVQPDYCLKHYVFPIFEPLIAYSGFRYAAIDRNLIREAVEWADVVHLMEGFPLEAAVVKIAEELGKPCVGTYHIFSENITSNMGLGEFWPLNKLINLWWKRAVYDHCIYIQCPTWTVRHYLKRHGYKSRLKVISNGIEIPDHAPEQSEPSTSPYRIITVGRLANEKSQITLIDAIRYSRHANEIELHIAGKGPKAKKIKNAAHRLFEDGVVKHDPVFGYYGASELDDLLKTSYLYIHCAKVEVEGLSCLEAVKQGVVPVIADAKLSATSQFALDNRSMFPVSDSRRLAEKIDWWIEHPEERRKMSRKYAESTRNYDIRESARRIMEMYEEALRDA